uniref:Uncharacterized protein n=1 Tax=feces metagenome TaxID=1861841 RepID=A0A7M2QMA3_9ZZZZ
MTSGMKDAATELARYSMPAGQADQRMAESRAVRAALGFDPDGDNVSPIDLVNRINALRNESKALGVEEFMETIGTPYAERDDGSYEDGFNRSVEVAREKAALFIANCREGAL